jgi:4-carboxymuconolactone decarboxylase
MLHHARLGTPLQQVGAVLRYEGLLTPRARELAILTVAAAHRAEFEWYAHAPIAADLGVDAAQIEAIRRGERPELDDPYEQAVVDLARTFVEHGDVDEEDYRRLSEHLSGPELVELTTLVGYYGILGTQMQLFRVPLPPDAEPAFSRV